jgi:hypothetical protein
MPPSGKPPRDVAWCASFEADLERLRDGEDAPAPVDRVLEEVDLVLGRMCEDYPEVLDTGFRFMNTMASLDLPVMTLWFKIESDEIVACYHLEPRSDDDQEDPPGLEEREEP